MALLKHRLTHLTLVVLAATMLGCSLDQTGQAIEEATAAGALQVELDVAGVPGAVYRLRGAQLLLIGPSTPTLTLGQPPVSQALAAGAYLLELSPGWVLEQQDGADYRPVVAELVSPSPTAFTIEEGQTTAVVLRMLVMGGGLDIRVDVEQEPTVCSVAPAYPALGPLVATASGNARVRGVRAPLGSSTAGEELALFLRAEHGVFAEGPIRPGTYTLSGEELDFATCGVCVVLHGARDPDTGSPRQSYLATGGIVTITSAASPLAGSLTDVTFGPARLALDAGETERVAAPCATSIAGATFSVPSS